MRRQLCTRRATHVVIFAGLIQAGCADDVEYRPARCSDFGPITDLPDTPLAYSTEHLDIHVDEDVMFCAGTVAEYESAYRHNHDVLGLAEPLHTRVFLARSVRDYCPRSAMGCRLADGTVVSNVGVVHHELGHASNCEWRNGSAPVLSEGLAVAFEVTPLTDKKDPREFITGERTSDFYYPHAGHFVRWLLETHGVERFRDAFDHAPRRGGEEVLEVLAAAYERPTEELFDEYMADPTHMWVPYRQCADLEILEPEAGVWEFQTVFDCTDPSTFGPWEREGSDIRFAPHLYTAMYQSFLIEVETPGVYHFERDDMDTWIEIERCVDQAGLTEAEAEQLWHRDVVFFGLHNTVDFELRAGTYRVDVQRQYAEPHPVWVRIADEPVGPTPDLVFNTRRSARAGR